MQLQSSPSLSSSILHRLPTSLRTIILWVLASTQFALAQDKPHGIAGDVNFVNSWEHSVLPSDPSPNTIWHQSLDADIAFKHIGTRWEVDDGTYGSVGLHLWNHNYSLAAHYVSNLYPNAPFNWHAVKNEMELRFLLFKQLTWKTQLQWWLWAFTEQPLANNHAGDTHSAPVNTSDPHDPHDPHSDPHDNAATHTPSHDSESHERLTIIAPTIGLQHTVSDKFRLLLTGAAGFDTGWSFHWWSTAEVSGTLFKRDRWSLIYNAGVNYATQIGPTAELSLGAVFTNRAETLRFFTVGEWNYHFKKDEPPVVWVRVGFSINLEWGHH